MKKGFIFDLDGTVIDSEKIHYLAYKQALKYFGVNLTKKDFIHLWLETGQGMKKFFLLNNIKDDPQKARVLKSQIFLKNAPLKFPIFPGVKKLLLHLKKNKLPCVLASGSKRNEIKLMLNRTNLQSYFDFYLGLDDVKHNKPDPEIFTLACEKLNFLPCDCLVFENTTNGILSAKAAGIACVAIPGPYSKKFDFSAADYVFKSFTEITPARLAQL